MKKTLALLLTLVAIMVVCLSLGGMVYAEDLSTEAEASNWFANLWATYGDKVVDALSGISLGTILSAIAVAVIKKETTKVANKVDDTNTINKLTSGVIDGIKDTKIDLSIQPIVKYELAKAVEIAYNDINKEQEKIEKMLYAIVEIQEAQANYFSASVGVPESVKEELAEKVENAKALFNIKEEKAVVVIETTKEEVKEEKTIENY